MSNSMPAQPFCMKTPRMAMIAFTGSCLQSDGASLVVAVVVFDCVGASYIDLATQGWWPLLAWTNARDPDLPDVRDLGGELLHDPLLHVNIGICRPMWNAYEASFAIARNTTET